MYANREVFPNAPLALVTTEIRFTDSPRLRQQATLDAVALALEEHFPISMPNVMVNVGNLAPGVGPQVEHRVVLMDTAKTESVTVAPSSFIYETTAYREFGDFREGVTTVCDALLGVNVRPALLRVGLRYINEVRVSEPITDARAWGRWIDNSLLGPLSVGPGEAEVPRAQGHAVFDLGDGNGLNFQYAALDQAPVVQPQFLRRQQFDPGPFFVIDLDGYREFGGQETVLLDADEVNKVLTAVRDPAGAAFQRAITEDARNLFRGEAA
jgi:uncharacterized protein (TIGR04255 family)